MNIKIIYDNRSASENIMSGWGFSCLADDDVLFDTGESGKSLIENMRNMRIDMNEIKHIIISHDHWDHTGGLSEVLHLNKTANVYGCDGSDSGSGKSVNDIGSVMLDPEPFAEIKKDIYTTGSVEGIYRDKEIREQSLVIKTDRGITLLTGCAHPGIVNIARIVKHMFSSEIFYCVLGGFHLRELADDIVDGICSDLKRLGIEKAGPAHCSGKQAIGIIKDRFGEGFITIEAGKTIEV